MQPFKGSGKGGKKRNKTMSACRIIHKASNTVSECQEERSFEQNKKKAFERLVQKDSFKEWHRIEIAKQMGYLADIEEEIGRSMQDIKIETCVDGKWTEDSGDL